MNIAEPKIRRLSRGVVMTKKDEAAFTKLLKDKFPGIVFAYIDAEALKIHYAPSIEEAADNLVHIWLPEPGWRPEWGQRVSHGMATNELKNLPAQSFLFRRFRGRQINASASGKKVKTLEGSGFIFAPHDANNPEARSFVGKVFRLSAKLLTNRYAFVDPDTGEVRWRSTGSYFWSGPDALQRCRTEEDVFIKLGSWGEAAGGRRLFMAPEDYGTHPHSQQLIEEEASKAD